MVLSGTVARTAASWRSSNSRITRGSWQASSIRSSRAVRSDRTRCSTGSSTAALAVSEGREPDFRAREDTATAEPPAATDVVESVPSA